VSALFNAIRIEVDWSADFVGNRTLRLAIPLTIDMQDDPLLQAILVRKAQLDAAIVANAPAGGDPFALG